MAIAFEEETISAQMKVAVAVIGHNRAVDLYGRLGALEDQLKTYPEADERTAPFLRDVMSAAQKFAKECEEDRKEAQKPHEQEIEKVRSAFRPIVERAEEIKGDARNRLNQYLERERIRLDNEAREAREKAAREKEEADRLMAELEASPLSINPAVVEEAQKAAAMAKAEADYVKSIASGGPRVASASGAARAAGYRLSYKVEVVDAKAMVRAFADHPDVQAAALKVANALARSTKGGVLIKGCVIRDDRQAV